MQRWTHSRTFHDVTVEPTDQTLWRRVIVGDGDSFGVIFDRHRSRVRRHAHGLVPNPEDAEDVVAVVFLEAWRRRSRVRFVDGSVLPWLLRTATSIAYNHTRSARRKTGRRDTTCPRPTVRDSRAAAWFTPTVSPVSTEQSQALADGVVTEDEYREGFARFEACLAEAGFALYAVDDTAAIIEYSVPGEAVWSGDDERCYSSEFVGLDIEWQVSHE